MGMSATQARLLALTSRMNDLEFRAESIANVKIRLADDSDKIAQEYTNELGKQRYSYRKMGENGTFIDVTINSISQLNDAGYDLYGNGSDGRTLYNPSFPDGYTLYEMLQSGEFWVKKSSSGEETTLEQEAMVTIESADQATLAKAEAKYNAAVAKIHRKEKELDRQESKLNTEHEALKTERDSLKEIISDNVSNSFKLFG